MVRVFSYTRGQLQREINAFQSVLALSFNPDGTLLACGTTDLLLRVYQVSNGQVVGNLRHQGNPPSVTAVAWTPDGSMLLAGRGNHTVQLWDPKSDKIVHTLQALAPVQYVGWTPTGSTMISGATDRTVRFWDTISAEPRGLAARLNDGRDLAGQAVRPAKAVVISEESRSFWQARSQRLDFGPHAQLFCRPFPSSPSFEQWESLMNQLLQLKSTTGLDLVVIDTLAPMLPSGVENSSDGLLRVLRPLDRLTEAGMAVLLVHHPRKGSVMAGQAARGSGALSGYVDIVIEMGLYSRQLRSDRRRRLSSWSRHSETPTDLVIELNPEGNDYHVCDDIDDELLCKLAIVSRLINERGEQLTRAELHTRWPERPRPDKATVWKYLETGVALGKLARHGAGHWQDPFRYTLPGSNLPWLGGVEGEAR